MGAHRFFQEENWKREWIWRGHIQHPHAGSRAVETMDCGRPLNILKKPWTLSYLPTNTWQICWKGVIKLQGQLYSYTHSVALLWIIPSIWEFDLWSNKSDKIQPGMCLNWLSRNGWASWWQRELLLRNRHRQPGRATNHSPNKVLTYFTYLDHTHHRPSLVFLTL